MERQKKIKIIWFIFAWVYLSIIVLDFMVVYPNEKSRPARDRLYGTVEMIEYDFKLHQIKSMVETVEQMLAASSQQWQLFNYLERSCRAIDPDVEISESNKQMTANFVGQAIIEYDATKSLISLTAEYKPSNQLFTFFPDLVNLHMVYKDIDYNKQTRDLQNKYDYIDFSLIEVKYHTYSIWILPRFILFGFLLWVFPVFIGYLFAALFYGRQRPYFNPQKPKIWHWNRIDKKPQM